MKKYQQWFNSVIKASLIIQFSLLFLYGCDGSHYESFEGKAQGTSYHVTVDLPKNVTIEAVKKRVDDRLAEIDKSLSTYREDSEISQFNRLDINKTITVSDDFIQVLALSKEVFDASQGAFDLTVKPLIDLWGFGSKVSLKNFESIPSDADITKAKQQLGFDAIHVTGNTLSKSKAVTIDVNGVAQGYSVDALKQLMDELGVKNYMVEVGGELATKGENPNKQAWHIGIDWPENDGAQRVYSTLLLDDNFVSTSGDYRDFYEIKGKRYSHTIDPTTGKPIDHRLASVTVITKNVALADAWCTAFMVLGEDRGFDLATKLNMSVYFIYREGTGFTVKMTKTMPAFLAK